MTLLDVKDLTTRFPAYGGPVPVVDSVTFTIARGEVLALVGESGCGKSLTALSLLRLVPKPGRIVSGTITFDGRSLLALNVPDMRHIRGNEVSMIFQEPMTSLNPVSTIGSQVIEAIRLHGKVTISEARRRTVELFKRVGVPAPDARLESYPHQLSGGLRQRVMIAMALASRPKLLIADEPTTALDVTIQAQLLGLLRELRRDAGLSILLITHDLGVVNELADRIAVMYAGRIVEVGGREEVLTRPAHPYTRGLLDSMPARARPGSPLCEIPGVVPPPGTWPAGCRFSNRCPRAMDVCRTLEPVRASVSVTHETWCHAISSDSQ